MILRGYPLRMSAERVTQVWTKEEIKTVQSYPMKISDAELYTVKTSTMDIYPVEISTEDLYNNFCNLVIFTNPVIQTNQSVCLSKTTNMTEMHKESY